MAQRDYILRLIEELGAALIALRNAILGGGAPPGKVEATLRRAASEAGMELELARAVSAEALPAMVAPTGEVEPARCWVLAEALMTDGVNRLHEGEPELARSSLAKAAVLFRLVAPWGAYLTGFPEASERIAEIEGLLRTAEEASAGRENASPRE
ncbi:MAG: hypothetical protein OXI83_17145 [Gemmatimonadota bacterium]|nr:hypothetical protein [Gemmatimonadota bacterium]